eukprot:2002065-Amphidinium_carterae.1
MCNTPAQHVTAILSMGAQVRWGTEVQHSESINTQPPTSSPDSRHLRETLCTFVSQTHQILEIAGYNNNNNNNCHV